MEQSEYAGIVENYLDTVYRAALSFCGNVQDAEDVVQNTFLKLFLKAPAFQSEEHIRRWLLRVAVLLLMFSNVIAYAATGRTWISTVILPDGQKREVLLESITMRTAAGTLRADFRKMIQEDEKNH
ncbi:MAG TPA: hypothetical protein IAD39_11740 [Candidatus Merdisoma faecalis]|nr:hypothetical protein [Candidatus Merdisoma faecalis]